MKNKFYELIGRAVVFLAGWGIGIYATMNLIVFILEHCCTTLK